jgi:hypothetical protein
MLFRLEIKNMSSILGMFGSGGQGMSTERMSHENAKLIQRQVLYEREKRERQKSDLREKIDAVKSAQKAKIGASGVALEGSPAEALMRTEAEGQRAIDDIEYWGKKSEYEAWKAAKLMRKAGDYALVNGLLSSGGQGVEYGYKVSQGFSFSGTGGAKTKNPMTGEVDSSGTDSGGWSFDWFSLF